MSRDSYSERLQAEYTADSLRRQQDQHDEDKKFECWIQSVKERLFPLVQGRLEWWREAVRRWASNPPHHIDDEGNAAGVLPIKFPAAGLSADERLAFLAAFHDTYAEGMEKVAPWYHTPSTQQDADSTTLDDFRMATVYGVLCNRIPNLRQHWRGCKVEIGMFLDEAEQQLEVPARRSSSADDDARTFSLSQLREMTGLKNSAINDYMKQAGVTLAGRGKKNHRYSLVEATKTMQSIRDKSTDKRIRARAAKSIASLKPTNPASVNGG